MLFHLEMSLFRNRHSNKSSYLIHNMGDNYLYANKWQPGPDPLELESKLKILTPPSAESTKKSIEYLRHNIENEWIPEEERYGLGDILAKKNYELFEHSQIESFAQEFQLWLMGRSRFNQEKWPNTNTYRTLWRSKSLLHLEDVRNYLTSFIDKRMNFQSKLVKLYLNGPKNLEESFIYFKYLVYGSFLEMDSSAYLQPIYAQFTDRPADGRELLLPPYKQALKEKESEAELKLDSNDDITKKARVIRKMVEDPYYPYDPIAKSEYIQTFIDQYGLMNEDDGDKYLEQIFGITIDDLAAAVGSRGSAKKHLRTAFKELTNKSLKSNPDALRSEAHKFASSVDKRFKSFMNNYNRHWKRHFLNGGANPPEPPDFNNNNNAQDDDDDLGYYEDKGYQGGGGDDDDDDDKGGGWAAAWQSFWNLASTYLYPQPQPQQLQRQPTPPPAQPALPPPATQQIQRQPTPPPATQQIVPAGEPNYTFRRHRRDPPESGGGGALLTAMPSAPSSLVDLVNQNPDIHPDTKAALAAHTAASQAVNDGTHVVDSLIRNLGGGAIVDARSFEDFSTAVERYVKYATRTEDNSGFIDHLSRHLSEGTLEGLYKEINTKQPGFLKKLMRYVGSVAPHLMWTALQTVTPLPRQALQATAVAGILFDVMGFHKIVGLHQVIGERPITDWTLGTLNWVVDNAISRVNRYVFPPTPMAAAIEAAAGEHVEVAQHLTRKWDYEQQTFADYNAHLQKLTRGRTDLFLQGKSGQPMQLKHISGQILNNTPHAGEVLNPSKFIQKSIFQELTPVSGYSNLVKNQHGDTFLLSQTHKDYVIDPKFENAPDTIPHTYSYEEWIKNYSRSAQSAATSAIETAGNYVPYAAGAAAGLLVVYGLVNHYMAGGTDHPSPVATRPTTADVLLGPPQPQPQPPQPQPSRPQPPQPQPLPPQPQPQQPQPSPELVEEFWDTLMDNAYKGDDTLANLDRGTDDSQENFNKYNYDNDEMFDVPLTRDQFTHYIINREDSATKFVDDYLDKGMFSNYTPKDEDEREDYNAFIQILNQMHAAKNLRKVTPGWIDSQMLEQGRSISPTTAFFLYHYLNRMNDFSRPIGVSKPTGYANAALIEAANLLKMEVMDMGNTAEAQDTRKRLIEYAQKTDASALSKSDLYHLIPLMIESKNIKNIINGLRTSTPVDRTQSQLRYAHRKSTPLNRRLIRNLNVNN